MYWRALCRNIADVFCCVENGIWITWMRHGFRTLRIPTIMDGTGAIDVTSTDAMCMVRWLARVVFVERRTYSCSSNEALRPGRGAVTIWGMVGMARVNTLCRRWWIVDCVRFERGCHNYWSVVGLGVKWEC